MKIRAATGVLWVLGAIAFPAAVLAHGGEDHSADTAKPRATAQPSGAVRDAAPPVRQAERTVTTDVGQFLVRIRQFPSDPRVGETVRFEARIVERIEGGFGGASGEYPVSDARVTASIASADEHIEAADIEATAGDEPGMYRFSHALSQVGHFKLAVSARTSDGRMVGADFPISAGAAPMNVRFWFGLLIVAAVAAAAYPAALRIAQGQGLDVSARTAATIAVGLLGALGWGVTILAEPLHERRTFGDMPPESGLSAMGDHALGGSGAILTISKESQLLFGIRTEKAAERSIVAGLRVTGVVRVRPEAQAVVSPPVSGRITLGARTALGAAVRRGEQIGVVEQVLGAAEHAALEGQQLDLRARILEQRGQANEQRAAAEQARARLNLAKREVDRVAALVEAGAASRKRFDEAQTAVQIATQELAGAEARAKAAAEQADLAESAISRIAPVRSFALQSPVSGLVADVRVASGQQVEAGVELLRVVDLSTVLVEARVFEQDLDAVRALRAATFTRPGYPDVVYRIGEGGAGRLVSIGATVDAETRAVPVVFEIVNPGNQLRDGMFVDLTIDTTGERSLLAVPKRAIVTDQGQSFVFVLLGGETFERRVVTLGAEGQDVVEVTSGLAAGDRVVVEGIYQLRSTQP